MLLAFFFGAHPNWRVAILAFVGLSLAGSMIGWAMSRMKMHGIVGGIVLLCGILLAPLSLGMFIWALDPLDNMGR
jgi:hypothetical protein